MKTYSFYLIAILALVACDDNHTRLSMEASSFRGKFKSDGLSLNLSGDVIFDISDGYYNIATDENPYARGAGKINVGTNTINFIDTLSLPTPAIYSNTSIPQGEYCYTYDGENLKIWKKLNNTTILYTLKLI